ncbi:MAG: hypothetical protein HC838_18220 [Spirulinaceae cyanobacterium RM2_2_10]|nr:hypothetical protein [Spirulinaceae cyanobacterium RM2_2_10]
MAIAAKPLSVNREGRAVTWHLSAAAFLKALCLPDAATLLHRVLAAYRRWVCRYLSCHAVF